MAASGLVPGALVIASRVKAISPKYFSLFSASTSLSGGFSFFYISLFVLRPMTMRPPVAAVFSERALI